MTPRTVLHVSEAFAGGLATAVADYVRATPEFRHKLAYWERPQPLPAQLLDVFDDVVVLPRKLASIGVLRRMLKNSGIDVVHVHSTIAGIIVRCLPKRYPVVLTPHGYGFLRQDLPRPVQLGLWTAEVVLSPRTDAVAACGPYEAARAVAVGTRLVVVAPNVPPARDREQINLRPAAGSSALLIGLGRLAKQKDPEFFLQSFQALKAMRPSVSAVWIGDGDTGLKERLTASGVWVSGWLDRSEVLEWLTSPGAVYLHSARWEGFPMALLEAAQLGVPSVVRDIPAMAGVDWPVTISDSEDAAAQINRLFDDGRLAQEVRSRQSQVIERFSPKRQAQVLTALYSKMIGEV